MGLTIRDATATERTDIARLWCKSYAPASAHVTIGSEARTLESWAFRRAHRAFVDALLAESDVHVLVVVLDEIPTEPLAWVCWQDAREGEHNTPTSLHYVYVTERARRKGLARRLVSKVPSGWHASHMTASGRALQQALAGVVAEAHA